MAGLLRDSEHEDDDATMGRVASPPLPNVYMEAMEEPKDQSQKLDEIGTSGMASVRSGVLRESLLESSTPSKCPMGNLKQKTRTGGILQYPRPIRVFALMRLNRRAPNGTLGGVGGRLGD